MLRNQIYNFVKYQDLLVELVKKDIKIKYRNSYLGVIWSLLNPLLMMVVLTFIFSEVFKNKIEHFPVYVLSGRLIYSFFSEATNFAMDSIYGNSQLIKKIYVPKYFFPLARVMSSFITSLIAIIPIFAVMAVTKVPYTLDNFLIVIPLLILLFIAAGCGLLLSTITVFFRDIKHFYSIILTILMYMTPIFYPANIIPAKYKIILELNPLYPVLSMFRDVLLYHDGLSIRTTLIACFYAVFYCLVGLFVFYKKQDRFIFHI